MLAGRLSDKMSSELGYYLEVIAELLFFWGGVNQVCKRNKMIYFKKTGKEKPT